MAFVYRQRMHKLIINKTNAALNVLKGEFNIILATLRSKWSTRSTSYEILVGWEVGMCLQATITNISNAKLRSKFTLVGVSTVVHERGAVVPYYTRIWIVYSVIMRWRYLFISYKRGNSLQFHKFRGVIAWLFGIR